MNVRDKNLAIREIRALLVLLSKMITKELAQAGWCGCGCSPAWARDAGGTGCAFTVLPPYILEKGISHPRSRSWAAFAVAFSKKKKKQLGTAAAQNQPNSASHLFRWELTVSKNCRVCRAGSPPWCTCALPWADCGRLMAHPNGGIRYVSFSASTLTAEVSISTLQSKYR